MKQHNKNNQKLVSNRLPVAMEDLATVFATELVRYCDSQAHLTIRGSSALARTRWRNYNSETCVPFLRMSFAQRRKLVEKVLDLIESEASKK